MIFRESETLKIFPLARSEMAQQENQKGRVKFCCSLCLDLLKDPVTIPCGHNYCMSCINTHWNEDQKKPHSCPQCQKTFTRRPAVVKNTMLADLLQNLRTTRLQAPPADHVYAGPRDVACDVCTGEKMKALKSCLICLASYCKQHLQPHYDSPSFKKHKLVEASIKLQETICSHHDEVMKIFCRTDQQCICYLCSMDEHKGHDIVSAAAERTERQKELEKSQQKLQQLIQEREKDLRMLQQEVESINCSAIQAVMYTEKISSELVNLIEKICSDVKQQIRSKQKTEVSRAKELQESLKQGIAQLRRKDAELELLSRTEDHTEFLHNYPPLSQLKESTDSPIAKTQHLDHFDEVTAAVTATRDRIQVILSDKLMKLSLTETNMEALPLQAEPKTRTEFLQYYRQITMDPNTANAFLVFSEGNRKITFQIHNSLYFYHPKRFIHTPQVLSKVGLIGRCYWEVEKRGTVAVGVAYKCISRTGDFNSPVFGYNEKSWVLNCSNNCNNYTFRHNNSSATILGPPSSRIGVYLDHRAGILSFYSVDETMTLLHRVQTAFTQPLYAGLGLAMNGDTAQLCEFK